MPSRIVINCWGSYGDVYPYIGLGKALQGRGHRVILALPRYYAAMVEREGLETRHVGPDVDPTDRELIARVMEPANGPQALVRDWLMPALRQSYEELREVAAGADLLVTHPATFAAPVLAQQQGLPWVATMLAPMSFFSPSDVPALPPAPRLVHLRRLGPWFGRLIVGLARRATASMTEPVQRLRADLGMPRGGNPLLEGQYSPILNLALFSRVIGAPQPDWPPHVEVTGFVFYNGPDVALSPAIQAFLAAGPAPVVFTLGTSAVGAAGTFYEESAAAIVRLRRRAVLLTGGFEDNTPRRTTSPDILIVDSAPHQLLFPHAAAIVHQGGAGTTGQALRAGRPTLVVPHSHDQPDNAFRVTNLGVARTVFPSAYRAGRVAREIDRLLRDPGYATRAAAVATQVRAEGGADAAAAAIARVL